MKHIFITWIFLTVTAWSLNAQTRIESADSAYNAGSFDKAAQLYNEEINENGTSADLLYNLGNSYYRLGHNAKAVLCYERALRLDPAHEQARDNLDFVNSKLIDKKGHSGTFIGRAFTDIANIMSSNSWAWLALALFIATAACAALYVFTSGIMLRKLGFFGGGAMLLLTLISVVFAIKAHSIAKSTDSAIVTAKSTILSTAPRAPQNRKEEAMLLHEGARLEIIDSISSPTDSLRTMWYDVMFDNDHRAWISSKDVEVI